MAEDTLTPDVDPPAAPGASGQAPKKKKKKDKVRSAWISFIGRIIAQIVGAIATVALTIFVVQKYAGPDRALDVPVSTTSPAAARRAAARANRPAGTVALAVLPLQNFSGDPQQDYFADGMTEALITDLSQIENLHVISRTSSMHYKGLQKPLPDIASELGVDLIVEGSVARSNQRVRITAQLIDASTDEHLWARSYERTVRDVLSLQSEIARAVAREVNVALSAKRQTLLADRRPVDPAAYDLYLKGRHAWGLRTAAGFQDALRYFDEAIDRDPTFAQAYSGLADTYNLLGTQGGTRDAVRARDAVDRALALDEGLAEAHASLGGILHRTQIDVDGAERTFRRAIELNPGYATAHQWYAILLAEEGRADEALRHAQRALSLDPLSAAMHQTMGLVHYMARRYDQAIAEGRRALELGPHLVIARDVLAWSLLFHGKAPEAIEVARQAPAPAWPEIQAALAVAYARSGDRARSDATVTQLMDRQAFSAGALAKWHAASGRPDAALDMLARLRAARGNLQMLKGDPVFDPIRQDPRFAELVRRPENIGIR